MEQRQIGHTLDVMATIPTEDASADNAFQSRVAAREGGNAGKFACVCGLLVALIGVLALAGWAVGGVTFGREQPGSIFTGPNDALGLVLLGASLFDLARRGSDDARVKGRVAGFVAALAAGAMGALALAQGSSGSSSAGPMAPSTALCFVLASGSLLLLRRSGRPSNMLSLACGTACGLAALATCVSFLYNVRDFMGLAPLALMPLHTGVALLLLAFGLVCTQLRGEGAFWAGETSGLLVKRMLPIVIVTPLILGWLRITGEEYHLYSSRFGVALRTALDMAIYSGLVLWIARAVRRLEMVREQSQKALQEARDELEEQVQTRTVELLHVNGALAEVNAALQAQMRQREQVEARLRDERNFASAVLDTADALICVVDIEGRLVRFNRSAEKKTGYSAREVVGQSFAELFLLPEELPEISVVFEKLKAGVSPLRHDNHWKTRSGEKRLIAWSNSVLRDEHGSVEFMVAIGRDITEQKAIERALRSSEARFQAFMDNNPAVAFIKDEGGRMVYVNRPYEEQSGMQKEQLIGRNDAELWPPEAARRVRDNDTEVLESGRLKVVEEEMPRPDGTLTTWLSLKFPLVDPEGNRFLAGMALDITDRKRAEQELRTAVMQLERSNRELQNFASVASHDLQEPLRKVRAFGDRLRNECGDTLSEDGLYYLDRMQHAAGRMSTLITDLLALSRVTTKAQPFVAVDLDQVAREVLSDLEIRVEESRACIELESLPVIQADPAQMRQLLQNLIGNALKFHKAPDELAEEAPRVKVSAQVAHDESGRPGACVLQVSDNGIGFDEKYLDRIFGIFQRLHDRTEFEGSGIGLAICRKIAERHGGDITARSSPGHGATFLVTLPLSPDPA